MKPTLRVTYGADGAAVLRSASWLGTRAQAAGLRSVHVVRPASEAERVRRMVGPKDAVTLVRLGQSVALVLDADLSSRPRDAWIVGRYRLEPIGQNGTVLLIEVG